MASDINRPGLQPSSAKWWFNNQYDESLPYIFCLFAKISWLIVDSLIFHFSFAFNNARQKSETYFCSLHFDSQIVNIFSMLAAQKDSGMWNSSLAVSTREDKPIDEENLSVKGSSTKKKNTQETARLFVGSFFASSRINIFRKQIFSNHLIDLGLLSGCFEKWLSNREAKGAAENILTTFEQLKCWAKFSPR